MIIKTFEGKTVNEAFDKMKQEMGKDAYILQVRTVKKKSGILGLRGKLVVEVVAADNINTPLQKSNTSGNLLERVYGKTNSPFLLEKRYQKEISEIRKMVEELLKKSQGEKLPGIDGHLHQYYERLIKNDVPEDLARGLVLRVYKKLQPQHRQSLPKIHKLIRAYLSKLIQVYGPLKLKQNKTTIIALIGPTGVGKTTTIAKLAAMYKLYKNKQVGLITTDTYRIAAVTHLRTYADIMQIPMEVAQSASELRRCINELSDMDVVFIDTAGRSQKDDIKMNELNTLMKTAQPDEIHLVISAVTGEKVLDSVIEKFSNIPTDSIILTKLDEAITFGRVLSIIAKTRKSISYLTTGQEVPSDIEIAESSKLVDLILR